MNALSRAIMAGAQASGPAALNLATWGTFSRATEASYIIGAPTTGSGAPFFGWAPRNVRRIDRRNGSPHYLTENFVWNRHRSTERPEQQWAYPSGSVVDTAVFPTPDGGIQRARVTQGSGGVGINALLNPVTTNQDWCHTSWQRSPVGATSYQHFIGGSTVSAVGSTSLGTTWTRAQILRHPDNAFGQLATWLNDGRNWVSSGGIAAGARDALLWGMQLEQGSYPTSYVRTTEYVTLVAERAADILNGPIASVPVAMINGSWSFQCAPVGASALMVRKNTRQVLFSFAESDTETVEFFTSGGACRMRVRSGGADVVTSPVLTFSADQDLTVTVDGAAGTLAISGATTGNGTTTGTPWTRAVGPTLYVGALSDGSSHADAALWCTGATAPPWSSDSYVVFTLGQSNMIQYGMHDRCASNVQQLAPDTKIIDGATGGTALATDWDKTGGTAYATAIARWAAAVVADPSLSTYTPVVIWVQGESDASNGTHAANYGTNLSALRTNLETDIPQLVGARWIVGQLHTGTAGAGAAATPTTIAQVRAGQAAFVTGLGPSRAALVDPSDLAFDDIPNLHYTNDAVHTYAARMGAAAVALGIGA